ncbi:peptidase S8/S53 domain-containing protein [Plectosphaerella cucumerina]|uniref:Peptidase S8/S53 domain-containing protein n=1 Tax=Plectosphaerella cucumerina TaxID=40658 RepID=A0A8K0T5S2_9PEZI|nr:peptidase S8/S53 domain-containing protein [Plectosphaerella cucumerina]
MLFLKSLSQASVLLGAALVAASSADEEALELFRPKRYIVEFSDAGSAKFRKRDGSRDTGEFRAILLDAGANVELAQSFTSEIFHGASFDLENAIEEEIEQIQNLPEVKNIWPATYLKLDVKPTTNVTRVHEQGILGEGVIVAVVDSGIDYTHPALGGGVGPGFKVEGGWNIIEDNADFKDCHGDESITGVAPKARLRGYKVFGCTGGSAEDVVMQGLLLEDGADVINASIGSDLGFPNTAIGNVISRIQAQGTFAVIAASNEGRLALSTTALQGVKSYLEINDTAHFKATHRVEVTIEGDNKFQGHFRTAGDGFEFVVADFPIRDFPRTNTQWWVRPLGTLAHGGRLGDGEYRILRRGLKTFGDPGSIEGWHWDLSPWFSVERGAAVMPLHRHGSFLEEGSRRSTSAIESEHLPKVESSHWPAGGWAQTCAAHESADFRVRAWVFWGPQGHSWASSEQPDAVPIAVPWGGSSLGLGREMHPQIH